MIEPHYLAQYPPTTIYLGHLDELHYVSTAAVTCSSDELHTVHILGQPNKRFFLNNHRTAVQKENAMVVGKGS